MKACFFYSVQSLNKYLYRKQRFLLQSFSKKQTQVKFNPPMQKNQVRRVDSHLQNRSQNSKSIETQSDNFVQKIQQDPGKLIYLIRLEYRDQLQSANLQLQLQFSNKPLSEEFSNKPLSEQNIANCRQRYPVLLVQKFLAQLFQRQAKEYFKNFNCCHFKRQFQNDFFVNQKGQYFTKSLYDHIENLKKSGKRPSNFSFSKLDLIKSVQNIFNEIKSQDKRKQILKLIWKGIFIQIQNSTKLIEQQKKQKKIQQIFKEINSKDETLQLKQFIDDVNQLAKEADKIVCRAYFALIGFIFKNQNHQNKMKVSNQCLMKISINAVAYPWLKKLEEEYQRLLMPFQKLLSEIETHNQNVQQGSQIKGKNLKRSLKPAQKYQDYEKPQKKTKEDKYLHKKQLTQDQYQGKQLLYEQQNNQSNFNSFTQPQSVFQYQNYLSSSDQLEKLIPFIDQYWQNMDSQKLI